MFFEVITGRIERGTLHSAAFDLFYAGEEPIEVGDQPVSIPTGLITTFSPKLVAVIKEKSGLALQGLEVKGGVIDADYSEEWRVIVRNPIQVETVTRRSWLLRLLGFKDRISLVPVKNWKPFYVTPGIKVAQFLLLEIPSIRLIGNITLKQEERKGGFGSTGKV